MDWNDIMRPKAIDVKVLENYELLIKFNNGEEKIFDVKPYFGHKIFEEMTERNIFNMFFSVIIGFS